MSWYFISFTAKLTASKETESFARPRYSFNIFVFVGGSFAGDESITFILFSFSSLSMDEDTSSLRRWESFLICSKSLVQDGGW